MKYTIDEMVEAIKEMLPSDTTGFKSHVEKVLRNVGQHLESKEQFHQLEIDKLNQRETAALRLAASNWKEGNKEQLKQPSVSHTAVCKHCGKGVAEVCGGCVSDIVHETANSVYNSR